MNSNFFLRPLGALVLLGLILAGVQWLRPDENRPEHDAPPVVHVWGSQLSVYYPQEKRVYVYSELGGNCVLSYTLTTPGGPVLRENCK